MAAVRAEAQEAISDEGRVAFALKRAWCEVAGQQEEKSHEVGLVGGAEHGEEQAGGGFGGGEFAPEPAAGGAVGDGGVVQDDEGGHDRAQAVYVEITRGGDDGSACLGNGLNGLVGHGE
jgi:hypothetical protein